MKQVFTLLIFASLIACQSDPKGEIADIIYINGQVITMEAESENASSVAVKDGKIIAVDAKSLVPKHKGDSTKVVDLKSRTMLPGFIDAHSHITMGMSLIALANLSSPPVGKVERISDIVSTLKSYQEQNNIPDEEWIVGWGYDPDLLVEKRHPNKLDLDKAFPNNPVFLLHASGHMAVLNSYALAMAKINEATPNPLGGMIVRLPNSNEPSGLLQETALYTARRLLPSPSQEQQMKLLEATKNLYASQQTIFFTAFG